MQKEEVKPKSLTKILCKTAIRRKKRKSAEDLLACYSTVLLHCIV